MYHQFPNKEEKEMIKSATTKFTRLLGLLISLALICIVPACGNNAETTADGNAAIGTHLASFTGSPTSVAAGQSSILTASVFDSSGNPVQNASVKFGFTNNSSGATLISVSGVTAMEVTVTTDANGQALAIYKAGADSATSALQDTIYANCQDSKSGLLITRTASSSTANRISLTAASKSLSAGKSTIITATVTNNSGSSVYGQAVTFAFATNNSGGTLTILGTGTTDTSGIATAVYTAGANNPGQEVYDNIQAGITGSASSINITRLSSSADGLYIDLTANKTSLTAGESTIITATVKDGNGNLVSGKTIGLGFITNNSGGSLSVVQATTDINGKATALYTAGANTSSTSVQDIISASLTGAGTQVIIITRTLSSSTGPSLTLTADKTTVEAGQSTIITVKVTNGSVPVAGESVTFSFLPGGNLSGAALSRLSGTTDANGELTTVYTAGSLTAATVEDIVQAGITGSTKAIIITKTGTAVSVIAASLDILASPTTVKSDDSTTSTITIRALNSLNAALSNVTVTVGTDTGVLGMPTAVTGSDGKATIAFSSGSNPINRTATITATAPATSGTVSAQIPVQIVGSIVSLSLSGTTLPDDGSSTLTLTVTATDAGGNAVPNTAVILTHTGAGDVTITPSSGTTNGSGKLTATVAGTSSGAVTLIASALGAAATKDVTVSTSGAVFGIDKQWLNAVDIGNPKPTAMKINTIATPFAPNSLVIEVNAPSPTTSVTFATTTGVWDSGTAKVAAKTVAGGKATATLTTTQAGIANVQVYDTTTPLTSDTLTVAMTSATAYKISLQATPTVVPKSVGTTTGFSTLIATVRDSSNYPVGDAPVSFSIVNPTGGGETISPVVVLTAATTSGGLNLGEARATFSSGSISSSMSGVQVRASVVGTTIATETSPSGNDATVVIGGTAGSIAIGRASKATSSSNNASYILAMSVLVADSNGNPAPAGTQVSLSAWPIAWSTGTYCLPDADYYKVWNSVTSTYDYYKYPNRGTFWGEDANENLIIDAGEDGNRVFFSDSVTAAGTGTIDGYLTPANSSGGTLPAMVTTDANGVANFDLIYLKASAIWTLTRIRASAIVQGSETVGQVIFRLPALTPDDVEYDPDTGIVKKCYLPDSPYIF
jgi:hypothetical protein